MYRIENSSPFKKKNSAGAILIGEIIWLRDIMWTLSEVVSSEWFRLSKNSILEA